MSRAKHTPGPWDFYTKPQPNGCPIVGARGLMVAMLAHSINYEDQKQEAIANARLISAAPELLEAAKMVLAWHDAETDPSGTTFWERVEMCRESEDALRTAVEKATGEAQ